MRKISTLLMMLFAFSAMAQINYGKRLWTFPEQIMRLFQRFLQKSLLILQLSTAEQN
jgi:hypothetical protein